MTKDKQIEENFSDILSMLKKKVQEKDEEIMRFCLLYTSPSPRDKRQSRMPSSA